MHREGSNRETRKIRTLSYSSNLFLKTVSIIYNYYNYLLHQCLILFYLVCLNIFRFHFRRKQRNLFREMQDKKSSMMMSGIPEQLIIVVSSFSICRPMHLEWSGKSNKNRWNDLRTIKPGQNTTNTFRNIGSKKNIDIGTGDQIITIIITNGYEIFKSPETSPKTQVNDNDHDGETISLNRKHGSKRVSSNQNIWICGKSYIQFL